MSSEYLPEDVPEEPAKSTYPRTSGQRAFLERTLIVAGIAALALVLLWMLWVAIDVLLLLFGGILMAVFMRSVANLLKRALHLPDRLAVVIAVLTMIAAFVGGIWWAGPRVVEQAAVLAETLIDAFRDLRLQLVEHGIGEQLPDPDADLGEFMASLQGFAGRVGIITRITGVFSLTLEALSYFLIIFFLGVFLAFEPGRYMRGIVTLLPHDMRERGWEVLLAQEHVLRWWLISVLISMVLIGTITTTGLWLLGVPMALALGLISASLEFIPILGPILGAIPALLVAFSVDRALGLYVLILYLIVQQVESNVIQPIILRHNLKLPPVITLSSQVFLGILAGPLGILFATPIAAVTLVFVKMVYVENILGDPVNVQKSGEPKTDNKESEG
jgi:predicted PurR-regulated permease PerM